MAIDLGDIPTGTPPTAGEKLQIRSAIGVGQTDAPTFLAQTLTGQSLTGTQATSLINLAATWDTTGTPSLIYARVTTTNANNNAKLLDLGTFSQGEVFSVNRYGGIYSGDSVSVTNGSHMSQTTVGVGPTGRFGFSSNTGNASGFVFSTGLYQDAAGILAQRNGTNAQTFRVYNTFPGTTANEWFEIDWKSAANTVRLFTNHAGTGSARSIDISAGATLFFGAGTNSPIRMYTGGVERWQISAAGDLLAVANNAYDIGSAGANKPRVIYASSEFKTGNVSSLSFNGLVLDAGAFIAWNSSSKIYSPANGVLAFYNNSAVDFGRLCLGGTTSAFPAIKRNGAGIDIVLANDSAFAPIKGKLTTDTNYAAGVPSATGYITIYDATGTAYRVPCTV